jgi:ankyrin repeat protein
MRRILILIAALWLAPPLHAQDIEPADLEVFFELVAVGPTAAVRATLTENAAYATARDVYGFEPIHMLDYSDFAGKLALLLQNGADINAQNDDGIGLIHILIDPEFLPDVIAAGADLNLRDAQDRTPLITFAQEPEGADMIRALLAAGADASLRDAQGHTATYYARDGLDDDLIQTLIKAGATDAPRPDPG